MKRTPDIIRARTIEDLERDHKPNVCGSQTCKYTIQSILERGDFDMFYWLYNNKCKFALDTKNYPWFIALAGSHQNEDIIKFLHSKSSPETVLDGFAIAKDDSYSVFKGSSNFLKAYIMRLINK